MTARVGTNVTVEVQASLDTAITDITALTLHATAPEATTTGAHGLSNGDVVMFTVTAGMVELDGQAARVANVAANTFELETFDTTTYSAWTAGQCEEVLTWATVSNSTSISMNEADPARLDATTLLDKIKKNLFGLKEAADGQMPVLFDPLLAGMVIIKAAGETNTTRVMRATWASGQVRIFNSYMSGGTGFDQPQNEIARGNVVFTPVGLAIDYAS